jgi:hypothetical protein
MRLANQGEIRRVPESALPVMIAADKFDSDKPPVGPDHLALAMHQRLLMHDQDEARRQIGNRGLHGKASATVGNITNNAVRQRPVYVKQDFAGTVHFPP